MAFDVGTAIGHLDLDTSGFSSGFNSAYQELQSFQDKATSASEKLSAVGTSISKAGTTLVKGVTVPIVGVGTAAIVAGNKFESAMSRVGAIAGATKDQMGLMSEQALQLGADTSFSASEAANGMENLASAGFSVEEIMSAMPGLLDLAASSGASVADASEIAAASIRGFGLEASDAGHVADVFAQAAARTNAQTEDMGEAMKYVAPVAKAMGQSLEQTAAAIGIMSDAGIKGSQAGTSLRGALSRLVKPTEAMQVTMDQLGLEFFDLNGNMLPLDGIISNLETGFEGLNQEQRNNALVTLFGQESLSGMLALVERGPEELVALTESFENADGAAADMATTMLDNTSGSIEQMMGSLETLGIKLQQVMAPAIKGIVDKITEFINKLSAADEATLQNAIQIGLFVAALGPVIVVVGKVISVIGTLGKVIGALKTGLSLASGAISALSAPIVIVAGVVATLVAAFKHLWDTNEGFKNNILETWERIKSVISEFSQGIVDTLNSLGFEFESITEVLSAIWEGFTQLLAPVFEAAFSLIADTLETVLGVLKGLFDTFAGLFSGDWDLFLSGIKQVFESIWDGIKNFFSTIWDAIKGIASAVFGWFGTTWEETWNKVKTFFVDTWNSIKTFFSDTWEAIKTGVSDGITAIVNFFKELPGKIWTAITEAFDKIKQWGADLLTWAQEAIPAVVDSIGGFFAELPGKMVEVGKNLLTGLWEGITGALTWLKDKIVGVGSSIVGWFKDIFGIHSPSRETAEMGVMLMEGLAVGMKSDSRTVNNSVEYLASMIVSSIEGLVSQLSLLMGMANSSLTFSGLGNKEDQENMAIYANQLTDLTNRVQYHVSIVDLFNAAYTKMQELFAQLVEASASVQEVLEEQISLYDRLTASINKAIAALKKLQSMQALSFASNTSKSISNTSSILDDYSPSNKQPERGNSVSILDDYKPSGTVNNNQFVFNSPKAISPTDAARLLIKTSQQIALGFK